MGGRTDHTQSRGNGWRVPAYIPWHFCILVPLFHRGKLRLGGALVALPKPAAPKWVEPRFKASFPRNGVGEVPETLGKKLW